MIYSDSRGASQFGEGRVSYNELTNSLERRSRYRIAGEAPRAREDSLGNQVTRPVHTPDWTNLFPDPNLWDGLSILK